MPRKWLETLETYANATYGRSIWSSIVAGICVSCGRPAHPFTIADAASQYPEVGLCQHCQDAQRPIVDTIVPFNQNYRTNTV